MDITKNEVEGIKVFKHPTLYFINKNKNALVYEDPIDFK